MYMPPTYHSYNYSQQRYPQISSSSQNSSSSAPGQYLSTNLTQFPVNNQNQSANCPPGFAANMSNLPPYA